MRNLKKILALVLALTMVLGLSISASAGTFTDVNEDDDYAAAIELLASLDVLAGMGDGTYNAAGSYTREQFTKILYVLVTGKDDGAAMYTEVAPFPDVAADRWSAGYINWAVQLGILVGRDDGLFHPTDVVNYAEACKMFLIAMGYSASMYTYPYGFIDKADSLKLFDDINGYATYAPANRGTVAQMAYNALFAQAPRFGTYIAKEGDAEKTETKQLIMGAFDVYPTNAILNGTSTNALAEDLYAENQVVLNGNLRTYHENVDELIGMQVKVWAKNDEKSLGNQKIYLIEDADKDSVYIINPYDVIDIDDSTASRVAFKDANGATRRLNIGTYDDDDNTDTAEVYGVAAIDTYG
ncbi:MAG: S-layer homology domain-containing protein, partial [Clostridia bacterium]|nr:S-layer homology domain-containing protein [Clostridia bacterium]